ncbi:SET domain-containing protein [Didymella exigua CBS 183.55]|uniref:SET domain-containing protein n=1 Tax=Didymella exigua CBS 183.55 TaxID=1150837 RepID=A0A6A5RZA5_9PLEO|nr:SET domain-containing protein [Didymella exigua CBS 183.55]KAF1930587.1 SET domain-containing protein [Didymella exigua CBS 183.55]
MYPSDDPTSTTASSARSISRPSSASSTPSRGPAKSLPAGAPSTQDFEVRDTPTAGRAVFASRFLPEGTLLWRSDDLTLYVLLREYRREVCGQCFSYDYGRDLPIRDQGVGFAFCSTQCQDVWGIWNGSVGVDAWRAVEALVKKRSKEGDKMAEEGLQRPTSKAITKAWEEVEIQASLIRTLREVEQSTASSSSPHATEVIESVRITKQHRKALSKALQRKISPDVMAFIVSGIIWYHNNPQDWPKVLALADDQTPYHSADDLAAFVRSYLHLLAILPLPLLSYLSPEIVFLLSSRDSHNSFGIRSLEDDGSEFFGYGCWPAASYFNHSCGPNIEQKRVGRVWEFRAGRDIGEGGELNITYLSGEEWKTSREKRKGVLKKNWGFDCACPRCEAI